MKKFLLIFALFALVLTAQAQKSYTFTADTTTNADTVIFLYPTQWTGNYDYAFAINIDSLTGTVHSASVVLQGAVVSPGTDENKWVTIGTAQTVKATLPVGTKSTTYIFTGTATPYLYYRIRIITSGTNTARCTSKWVWKT